MAAAAWASSTPRATNASGASSRSKRCRPSTRAIASIANGWRAKRAPRRAFTHEAIATVYALEEIDGELYIASELVQGETLRAELARGPVPPDRLVATLVDIASGLSAAAQPRSIIHRDLKPENIIRRTDGHIKILDFGLARVTDPDVRTITRLTESGTAPGTPGYMAPEQLGGGPIDGRTDLFAFGIVAWELATGEHPFGSNPARHARAHDGGPCRPRSRASSPSRRSTRSSAAACACRPPTATRRPRSCSSICATLTTPSGTRFAMAAPLDEGQACGGGSSIRAR